MELAHICKKHGADKLQNGYINVYEKIFSEYKDAEINFLEIGVYGGNSARLWNDYFTKANVYLCDIFDKNEVLKTLDVKFFQGDASNPDKIKELIELVNSQTGRGQLDIVIDDGSHFQYDQNKSLGYFFPHISNGGIYIIEDICMEERLKNGSMWWGHSQEPHHSVRGECHFGSSLRPDKEWLAGNKKDIKNSTDSTIKRYIDTGYFDSKYLTKQQNDYLTKNIETLQYYSAEELGSTSKLAVFRKEVYCLKENGV